MLRILLTASSCPSPPPASVYHFPSLTFHALVAVGNDCHVHTQTTFCCDQVSLLFMLALFFKTTLIESSLFNNGTSTFLNIPAHLFFFPVLWLFWPRNLCRYYLVFVRCCDKRGIIIIRYVLSGKFIVHLMNFNVLFILKLSWSPNWKNIPLCIRTLVFVSVSFLCHI